MTCSESVIQDNFAYNLSEKGANRSSVNAT